MITYRKYISTSDGDGNSDSNSNNNSNGISNYFNEGDGMKKTLI